MAPHSSMDKYISSQFSFWKNQKNNVDIHDPHRNRSVNSKKYSFITISREYGCMGFTIAAALTEILNKKFKMDPPWAAYDRELLERVMKDMGLASSLLETMTGNARKTLTDLLQSYFDKLPSQVAVYRKIAETVRVLAEVGHVILVGRASNIITRDMPGALHIRIIGSMEFKVNNIAQANNISKKEAEKLIKEKSLQRDSFIKEYIKFNVDDPQNYDLINNNSTHTTQEAAQLIIEALQIKKLI